METTKRKFTVRIASVTKWRTDCVEFAATASHEGDDATLDIQLEERRKKIGSEAWNIANLQEETVRFDAELDRDDDDTAALPDDVVKFDGLADRYRKRLEVTVMDGVSRELLMRAKQARDVLLYCMNVIMRHLNDEEAQEPWLVNGIPDGTAVEEPGEDLVREIAEANITKDTFEFMLRTFVRTLATEVFPDVEFGKRHETMALY